MAGHTDIDPPHAGATIVKRLIHACVASGLYLGFRAKDGRRIGGYVSEIRTQVRMDVKFASKAPSWRGLKPSARFAK